MRLRRLIVLTIVLVAIGIAVAALREQRRRFMAMSDDEIRAMLAGKLATKVDDEQLAQIQDAVITAVRAQRGEEAQPIGAVTGTLAYREKIAMPADAVVIVQLLDTSKLDVPAEEISTQLIEDPGSVPVPYKVSFDPAEIVDNHAYSVRATIESGDDLLWTTDTSYPVITNGNPLTADLLLIKVPEPADT